VLLAGEVKGELARIQPARACDRRAELIGLLLGSSSGSLRTLDHATARTAVHLASSLGLAVESPRALAPDRARSGARHHLVVDVDRDALGDWSWDAAPACDRRAFLRGVLLGSGSISFGASGPHVEFVFADRAAAEELQASLATGMSSTSRASTRSSPSCAWSVPTAASSSWRRIGSGVTCRRG
jgi:hypothetical protein